MPFKSLADLEPAIADLLQGAPPMAWRLAVKGTDVPKEMLWFAHGETDRPFPGVWEMRIGKGPYEHDLPAAIANAARDMDDRVYEPAEKTESSVGGTIFTSRIGDSPFARVIGPGGRIMVFIVGEESVDLVAVIRRREAPIPVKWHKASVVMNVIRRRMPDVAGMTFHFDAGYFELGMTEPQTVIRPVVLVSATFTPAGETRPVWADAMVVPVTRLDESDDEGFGSWRNHEFC